MSSVFLKIKLPLLLILAVGLVLAMLRLGVWQLERAEQKAVLLNQVKTRAEVPPVDLQSLLVGFDTTMRFRNVLATGRYLADKSIYIDNQVIDGQVGYRVFTPLLLSDSNTTVMVGRGWISVGESRAQLPEFDTSTDIITVEGRFNNPPAKPPIWDDKYQVADGQRWQYLPLQNYAEQMRLTVLPLVLELAPEQAKPEFKPQFKRAWADINDEWVAKHQGYAFQWFAMALAFGIACLVLLVRRNRTVNDSSI